MDKQMGNGKKKFTIWLLLILVVLLAGAILYYRLTMGHMLETQEISDDGYTVKWDNKKYVGKYDGEYSNSKPNGEGTFTSDDGELTYQGNWKKGKFDGEGIITHSDGTWETGEYKAGKRNGLCRVYSSENTYVENFYNKSVPYGKTSIYENGVLTSTDYYVNSILLSELKSEAKLLSSGNLQNAIYGEQYVYVEGKVVFVGEDDESCYFRIASDSAGMVIGSYQNGVGLQEEQVLMPVLKVGDKVRIYGYCMGTRKNNYIEDSDGYRYEYIYIQPFYGENLSAPLDELEAGSYALHQKYPYIDYDEGVENNFVVLNVTRKGKTYYLQVRAKNAESKKEQYTLIYKGEAGEFFLTGEELHINGYHDGLYKRLQDKELNQYNKNKEQNNKDIVYTYLYDIYPVIRVVELKR